MFVLSTVLTPADTHVSEAIIGLNNWGSTFVTHYRALLRTDSADTTGNAASLTVEFVYNRFISLHGSHIITDGYDTFDLGPEEDSSWYPSQAHASGSIILLYKTTASPALSSLHRRCFSAERLIRPLAVVSLPLNRWHHSATVSQLSTKHVWERPVRILKVGNHVSM